MKRHPTRKILSGHRRGEHAGYNALWARRGCPECRDDVERVMDGWRDVLNEARVAAGLEPVP